VTGAVVWFTGLPQSGKSTLAIAVQAAAAARGQGTIRLDGDELRPILAPGLGAPGARDYTPAARDVFYARLARLAGMLAAQGVIVLVAATAPRVVHREAARAAAPRFVEVYVATSLADCAVRDRKGLYEAARAGRAPELPGVGASFEPPFDPDVIATGGHDTGAIARVVARITRA